jgi:uncharacterized protein with NRDE domain
MCTLVVLRRPGHHWPLLLAGNRDELRDRPWSGPARHWHDRPEVIAGRDELAGGSWFGISDFGLAAVVMNRTGTLGPQPGMRSRGELVLEALDHGEAQSAARALADLDPAAYRPFNLFIGDADAAFWLANRAGAARIVSSPVSDGLHMLAAGELDDAAVPRIRDYLPRFRQAAVPDVGAGDWGAWQALLASRAYRAADGPAAAMDISLADGLETRCSHCVAIPARRDDPPVFLFAPGRPATAAFEPVVP